MFAALTPFVDDGFGLAVSLGLLASMGSGIGSFSVLIGAAAQRLPADARGAASGVINAGGSFGQFVFAPSAASMTNCDSRSRCSTFARRSRGRSRASSSCG